MLERLVLVACLVAMLALWVAGAWLSSPALGVASFVVALGYGLFLVGLEVVEWRRGVRRWRKFQHPDD